MIEVELPDGTIAEFPDGTSREVIKGALQRRFAQPSPESLRRDAMIANIARAKSGQPMPVDPVQASRQAQIDRRGEDEMIVAGTGGYLPNAARQFTTGIPFVGSYADEAAGLLGGEQAGEQYRQSVAAFERLNPGTATGLQIAGGVAGSIPLAAAAPTVAGGGPLASQALRLGAAGAVAGGVEGGVYGAGQQDGSGRLVNAAQGAAIGGGLGGVLGAAAPVAASGISRVVQAARRTPERQVAAELGIRPESARLLASVMDTEDPTTIAQSLARSGPNAMLADAGPTASGVLDTTMQAPGRAARTGRERVEERAAGALTTVNNALDASLGSPQGLISIAGDIRQARQPAVREAYSTAYDTPIDYSGEAGRRIEGLLSRLPKSTAGRAIAQASERMSYDGVPNAQIMATIGDDGSVSFQQMPNVMQLDYIKRAFDDIARNGTDAVTGKMNADAAFASRIARDIRNATRDAVPAYGQALELAADSITTEAGVETGRRFLAADFTREQASRALDGATEPEKAAIRAGLRAQIDDTLANVRAVASDGNVDAREARQALSLLTSRASKAKIRTLLGAQQAETLLASIDEAAQALSLRAAVATNSRTAGRQMTNDFIQDVTAPGPVTQAMQGRALGSAQEIVASLTGTTARDMSARSQQIMNDVTDILTRSGAPQAQRALELLRNVSENQPLSDSQARLIAGIVTGIVESGAYQSGQRLTGSR